jgi:hypothetical protein
VPQDPPARLTDFRERWRVLDVRTCTSPACCASIRKLRSLSGEEFVDCCRPLPRVGGGGGPGLSLRSRRRRQHRLAARAAETGRFALELVPSVCIDDTA